MIIVLNDKEIAIPSSQAEFTLGQRIDFHIQYGKALDDMLAEVIKTDDPELKDALIVEYEFEKMFSSFAFFAGTTVKAVKESRFIDEVAKIYHHAILPLFDDDTEELISRDRFQWNGEDWGLDSPEIKNGSPMKFGEFIDAKQLIKDMATEQKGKWEQLLPVSVIYLRKKGEPYTEAMLYDDSERLKVLRDLPMDIAIQVGFFLSDTTSIWTNTLKYSGSPGLKAEGRISRSITTAMAGSIFLKQ